MATNRPLRSALAGGLVFGLSGSVLVLEILAARLLAPYVGLTLETYTTIIGDRPLGRRPGSGRDAGENHARPLSFLRAEARTLLEVFQVSPSSPGRRSSARCTAGTTS